MWNNWALGIILLSYWGGFLINFHFINESKWEGLKKQSNFDWYINTYEIIKILFNFSGRKIFKSFNSKIDISFDKLLFKKYQSFTIFYCVYWCTLYIYPMSLSDELFPKENF
jgi:hypothetical protein